jgi:hypothetical protein
MRHFALHLAAGLLLVLAAFCVGARPELAIQWQSWQSPLFAAGVIIALLGAFYRRPRLAHATARGCVLICALLLSLATLEIALRWIRYDFRKEEARYRATPPFYRQPMISSGTVYFRRAGPEEWRGQVIRTQLERLNHDPQPYDDEPVVAVRYNEHGFRHEEPLADWEIAIAGDSFTELGHLPFNDLFTTQLQELTGQHVLNLGVSHTGPLTQLHYLEAYGAAPSLAEAFIMFFEGNDLEDLRREYAALAKFERGGPREHRQFRRQTSFLRALGELVHRSHVSFPPSPVRRDAVFDSHAGPTPVTIGHPPPALADLSDEQHAALHRFFAQFADFGRARKVRTWLAYVPCKQRVLHDWLDYSPHAQRAVREWAPNDLPQLLEDLCRQHQVRFIDLTPSLKDHVESTRSSPYNRLYDSHLNAAGSRCIAQALAAALLESLP